MDFIEGLETNITIINSIQSEVYMIKIMSELRIKNTRESDLRSCEVT